MKQNNKIITCGQPVKSHEHYTPFIYNDSVLQDGLWMEFEDSFIQVLSGIEPEIKYYSTLEMQEQIAC